MAGVNLTRPLIAAAAVAVPLLLASSSAFAAMATGTISVVISAPGGGGVNDAPVMSEQTMTTVAENQGAGVSAGTVEATDPDAGDTLTFAITTNSGGLFAIDSATGELTTTASLDYESAPSHSLTVQVTDTGLLSVSATVTVPVGDVNETVAPVATNDLNNQNNASNPDAVVVGSTTTRGLGGGGAATAPEIATAPPDTTTETTTEETTETTQAAADSGGAAASGEPSAQERFASESRSASQLFGQPTSIGVVGSPNQHFSVSLPGQTSFATGSEVVNVAGFSHNAGLTPAVGQTGAGTFAVGAQLAAEGGDSVGSVSVDSGDQSGGGETGGDTGGTGTAAGGDTGGEGAGEGAGSEDGSEGDGPLVFAGPIVTRSPFVSVVVSYN